MSAEPARDPFAAIADPVRRALVVSVAGRGPARVVDLAAEHPISRPAISRHLRLLVEAGVLIVADRGRERLYSLDPAGLEPVRAWLRGLPRVPVDATTLDALDLEVRRTRRDREGTQAMSGTQDPITTPRRKDLA